MDENALFGRLDGISERLRRIASLLEVAGRKPPLHERIMNIAASAVTIMGILSAAEIIRTWLLGLGG